MCAFFSFKLSVNNQKRGFAEAMHVPTPSYIHGRVVFFIYIFFFFNVQFYICSRCSNMKSTLIIFFLTGIKIFLLGLVNF